MTFTTCRGVVVDEDAFEYRRPLVLGRPDQHGGPAVTMRKLRSEATYEDGEEFEREFELEIPDDISEEALDELLQPETGFGHSGPGGRSLDAYYEITSIDGLEPEINYDSGG